MERYCYAHVGPFWVAEEFFHLWQYSNGGDSYARVSNIGMREYCVEGGFYIFVIGEGFTHAHIHNVGDLF